MAMWAHNPWKEVKRAAVITLGQQNFVIGECTLKNVVWSCGVLHLRSPSNDPVAS
jgi:hypothetical protein